VFQENLRKNVDFGDVVGDARKAVDAIKNERGKDYRAGMLNIHNDPRGPLPFDLIDNALADITKVQTFKGRPLNMKTQAIREEIGQVVDEWRRLPKSEYHTAEGMDAMKKEIGSLYDRTKHGSAQKFVVDEAYNAIKDTIIRERPEYGKIMQGYEKASDLLREIENTLSTKPTASVDTALRKLQSVLRDNVNTNYGQRAKLAEYLVEAGAPHLMEALAGQALSSWMPRGLGKALGAQILSTVSTGGVPYTLPFMFPRIVGEGAYYAGKAGSKVPGPLTGHAFFQIGRQKSEQEMQEIADQVGAKRAADGEYYAPDPNNPGKFVKLVDGMAKRAP
jgi:hypothetical protein